MGDIAAPMMRPKRGVRLGLWLTLVVLIVLLAMLLLFAIWASRPIGAPPVSTDRGELEWVRSIYGWGDRAEQQFSQPTDVAIGPDGTIWGTDPARARVLAFSPEGTFEGLIHTGPASAGEGMISRPEGIGTDADGNVYIADFGNDKVIVFTPDNGFLREWEIPSPMDVAVSEEYVWVSTVFGIARFDMSGQFQGKWGVRGSGDEEFDVAHGIAVSDEGRVFVADSQNARVKAYDQDGTLLWIAGERSTLSEVATETIGSATMGEAGATFQVPTGMTVDGEGRAVLVDAFEFAIDVVDPEDGTVLDTYGEYGAGDGSFVYPTGIDYDPSRDWFVVADTANDRLQVVRIPGSGGGAIEKARGALPGPMWLWLLPLLFALLSAIFAFRAKGSRETVLEYVALDDVGGQS